MPYSSASYGQTESQADMTRFIQDSANAWYAAEVAKGKTPAQVNAYLATFDQWDRYDYDGDGDFDEADGYIDHFQAVRAGEDESAGAPSWMIWAHRWSVGQTGRGTTGPASSTSSAASKVGDSGFWIRDYTTEPENGGLGVFAHEYAHDLGLPDLYDTVRRRERHRLLDPHELRLLARPRRRRHRHHAQPHGRLGEAAARLARLRSTSRPAPGRPSTSARRRTPPSTARPLVVELPKDAQGSNRFYIAENRQYLGLDTTLQQGPYNFGWARQPPPTASSTSRTRTACWSRTGTPPASRNTVAPPPGRGPGPAGRRPPDGADVVATGPTARNRIQTFDATFGTEATDAISLHRETAAA